MCSKPRKCLIFIFELYSIMNMLKLTPSERLAKAFQKKVSDDCPDNEDFLYGDNQCGNGVTNARQLSADANVRFARGVNTLFVRQICATNMQHDLKAMPNDFKVVT